MKIKIGAVEYAPRMPMIATINRLVSAWFDALQFTRRDDGTIERRGPIDGHLVGVVGAAIAAELLPASDRDRFGLPDLWSFPTVAAYGAAVVERLENQKVAQYVDLCANAADYFDALQSVTLTDDDAAAAENPI